jgi:hypothetical protein
MDYYRRAMIGERRSRVDAKTSHEPVHPPIVNGEVKQNGNTSQFIFTPEEQIEYASNILTIETKAFKRPKSTHGGRSSRLLTSRESEPGADNAFRAVITSNRRSGG